MFDQLRSTRAIVSVKPHLVLLQMCISLGESLVCKGTLLAIETYDGTPILGDSVIDRIDVEGIHFAEGTHYLAYDLTHRIAFIRTETCWMMTRWLPIDVVDGDFILSKNASVKFFRMLQ